MTEGIPSSDKRIPLVECFGPTIQGEGAVIGQQTYFLRFGLCDYKCTMCDSMHAVDPRSVKKYATFLTQQEIFQKLQEIKLPNSTNWVTFSGGNPCIHNLKDLCSLLKAAGWRISVETQGTYSPPWLMFADSLTVSPKGPGMGEVLDIEVLDRFIDLNKALLRNLSMKVVVFDQRDLDFAADLVSRYSHIISFDNFYLSLGNDQPPDKEGDSSIPEIIHQQRLLKQYKQLYEDISIHPWLSKVRFLPQWHVFVWGNEKGH